MAPCQWQSLKHFSVMVFYLNQIWRNFSMTLILTILRKNNYWVPVCWLTFLKSPGQPQCNACIRLGSSPSQEKTRERRTGDICSISNVTCKIWHENLLLFSTRKPRLRRKNATVKFGALVGYPSLSLPTFLSYFHAYFDRSHASLFSAPWKTDLNQVYVLACMYRGAPDLEFSNPAGIFVIKTAILTKLSGWFAVSF
jgi:hypothetical protein